MDTCSRLEEPGGVGWKHVNVDRSRTTISGKRSIWLLRAAVRSGRWPRSLGCATPYCGAGREDAVPQRLFAQFPTRINRENISKNREFFAGIREFRVTDHGLRMAVDTDSFVILFRSAPPADRF